VDDGQTIWTKLRLFLLVVVSMPEGSNLKFNENASILFLQNYEFVESEGLSSNSLNIKKLVMRMNLKCTERRNNYFPFCIYYQPL